VNQLLEHGADVFAQNRHQWTVFNESICTGSPEMIAKVMERRDQQNNQFRTRDIPRLLERLETSPDFYVEMKWEFSSWVPFVSRMCPNDTYCIWKKGERLELYLRSFDHW
jgi:septin 4